MALSNISAYLDMKKLENDLAYLAAASRRSKKFFLYKIVKN
jgi:hypothetical protein